MTPKVIRGTSSLTAERRNARRSVLLLVCVALAAFGRSGHAQADDGGNGLTMNLGYTGDLRRNTTGGLETGSAYSNLIDLGATWTSNRLFADAFVTTNVSVMYIGGDAISGDLVGDLHGVNNIEGPAGWHLYEAWSEFSFGGRSGTTVRAGMLDLNADFDTPVSTALFVGSPHGIGTELSQTGGNGPDVWPVTGFGIRVAGAWNDRLRWRFGAYEGSPGSQDESSFATFDVARGEGSLLIGEVEYTSDRVNKISIGTWSYTAAFERLDAELTTAPAAQRGNRGVYALVDLPLGHIGAGKIDGALRVGTADPRFNPVDQYAGLAFTLSHPFANRVDDAVGLAIAHGRTGAPYRAIQQLAGAPAASAETSVELTYRAPVADWLALAPSVQLVSNPGADLAVRDAWVVGLRFEISQEKSWQTTARNSGVSNPTVARSQEK